MLLNISYNSDKNKDLISSLVGKPYSLWSLFKIGKIGSPRLKIISASNEISDLLSYDNNISWCNIELRPKGIILRFRSLLETYGLIIPYYKLTLFKSDSNEYSFYCDVIKIKVVAKTKNSIDFIKKILIQKNKNFVN
tara:strand:- start:241 stop:651 length:411 start_codon:yes stop_codon:yes gene_type:complete